jgi:hypothetical protein
MDLSEGGDKKKGPRVNVTRSLSDVIGDVERIVERGERVLKELCAIERAVAEKDATPTPRRPRPRPPAPAGPAPTEQNLCFEVLKNGRAAVSFPEGKRVSLPPALAALFAILASGEDQSPDELVGWKSLDRIGRLLKEQFPEKNKKYSHHAVLQLLSRLRATFRGAGLDPRLIESAAPLGARLRLKRRPAAWCAA